MIKCHVCLSPLTEKACDACGMGKCRNGHTWRLLYDVGGIDAGDPPMFGCRWCWAIMENAMPVCTAFRSTKSQRS